MQVEVLTQITNDTPLDKVKVALTTTSIKSKSASWIMSSWQEIEKRPEIADSKRQEFLIS